jgi:hypothetical protein
MRTPQVKLTLPLALLCFCGVAGAQNTRGYLFAAPGEVSVSGVSQRIYHLGGGVERLLEHGVGAGAELGAVLPGSDVTKNTVGIFSANGYYHFLRERKLDPFATAGYSLLFRDYSANMFNYGGGLNYWFQDNLGLRLEIRDHTHSAGSAKVHYWGFGVGVTFR